MEASRGVIDSSTLRLVTRNISRLFKLTGLDLKGVLRIRSLLMTKDHVDDLLEPLQNELTGIDFAPWALTLRIQRLANYLHLDESAYEPFGINRAGVDILVQLRQNAPQYRVSPTQL